MEQSSWVSRVNENQNFGVPLLSFTRETCCVLWQTGKRVANKTVLLHFTLVLPTMCLDLEKNEQLKHNYFFESLGVSRVNILPGTPKWCPL